MDWQAIISVAAIIVAIFTLLTRTLDKSLSIREHEEFRNSIKGEIVQLRIDYKRDDDRLEKRVEKLEDTRPTTGELQAHLETHAKGT